MHIRIEFFGIARSRAGASECVLSFFEEEPLTLRRVLRELAERYAGLQGECIADGQLLAAFTVNLNGERFVRDPEQRLGDGDCLLLLSADAGG